MNNPTNDIDDLMCWLSAPPRHDWDEKPIAQDRYYRALDALVAERDKLAADLKWTREQHDILSNSASMNAKRIRDLERQMEAHPPADRDRELRERLVCAALTGLAAHPSDSHPMHNLRELAVYSATAADLTLAAMRKGDGDGK